MVTKTINFFAISVFFITLSACSNKPKQIDEKEAIRLAEEFVKTNGYTEYKSDGTNFEFEVSDNLIEQNIPATLKKRHNTLQPKAVCILKDKFGWHIGFLQPGIDVHKYDSLKQLPDLPGRTVNLYMSGEIRMSQKTPLFSNYIKLK